MIKIAHLSDIHLGPLPPVRPSDLASKRVLGYLNWKLGRRRVHQSGVLRKLISDIDRQRVDHIALTGDLVNISLPDEFSQAAEWLSQLGKPDHVSLVPGNHDAYVNVPAGQGLERWQSYMTSNDAGASIAPIIGESFPYVRRLDDVALVGLSSAIPTLPFMASGELGASQLNSLRDILAALSQHDIFRIVLIHHPPLPGQTSSRRALSDAESLRDILKTHGAELVLFGHNHLQSVYILEGEDGTIPVVGAPSASSATTRPWQLARYNCFSIGRRKSRWTCQMIGRGLVQADGKIEKLEHIWLKA